MSIEINRITKSFGDYRALDDVSLAVPAGQLVALLGPSGSGKTTLLRIIAGLEQADAGSGSILFHEQDVAGTHVRHRRVGFVFQHYALFRHMSVFENVAFGLRVKPRGERPGKREIRAKVIDLLRLVQLDGLASRHPNQLSGGQRQRVALARALAVEPKVLLLDEPFGALDAKVRQELRSWLRRLHAELHVTSVFVTHDQDEALEVADQVVVMQQGRVEQVGTPDEVYHHPRSEFVMNFLGEVNCFHGRLESDGLNFADVWVNPPAYVNGNSADARIFIRPHELDVGREPKNGHPSLRARLVRTHSAGPSVRLELKTESGDNLHAEISQDRFRELAVRGGDTLHVTPRDMRVF
ncbi:MAG: TOBE-like domain-containing protein [Nitrococcus sp.]|nr:TOBE-like domain-containing protein [Nitrococcus sp.]